MSANYSLKFISGKYQGGEFPLMVDREIVVGRAADLDMVLVEDMVSRKHAKISTVGGAVTIMDLGSTNGTFVNGEKIKRQSLNEGDRVLIGTSILKMIAAHGPAQQGDAAAAKQNMQALAVNTGDAEMSGLLEDVPVPDLLQLLTTSKRTGVLVIQTQTDYAKVYFRDGAVFYANYNDDDELGPMKALCRAVSWSAGHYAFTGPEDVDFMLELEDSTESLLAKAHEQNGAYATISGQLPQPTAPVDIPRPLEMPLSMLTPDELDVFQLVLNFGQLQAILDNSPSTDFETGKALISLIEQGYAHVP